MKERAAVATKRVAIYARRSDETGDRDRSIVEQVDLCRRWADERGHSVVRVYEELGSGTSGEDRPIFCSMIEAAQKKPRPFDTIVVLDVSRFGRTDNDEAGYWKHTLRKAGVSVSYILDGEALEGPAGQIVGAVLQMAARDHSVKTAFKVAAGQLAVIKAGFWPGGACPYGYRFQRNPNWTGKGRRESKLVIHDGEAAVVRRIYDLREKGLGYHTIAKALNVEPVPGPRGGSWDRVTIRKILENRAYVGDLVRSRHRRRSKFYTASETGVIPIEKSDGAGLVTRDALPVIVDRAQFDRVQRLACGKRTRPSGGVPGLLTGLARCRVCGGRLGLKGARPQGRKRYRYYRCERRREHGDGPADCGCVTVRADFCEEAVLKAVQAVVAKLDAGSIAAEVRRLVAVNVPATNVEALEAKRRRLAARRDALLLDDAASEDFMRQGLARLAEEDKRLVAEVERTRDAEAQNSDMDARIASVLEAAQGLAAPETVEGREILRQMLGVFVRRLDVGPAPSRQPKPVALEILTPAGLAFTATATTMPLGLPSRPPSSSPTAAGSGFGRPTDRAALQVACSRRVSHSSPTCRSRGPEVVVASAHALAPVSPQRPQTFKDGKRIGRSPPTAPAAFSP